MSGFDGLPDLVVWFWILIRVCWFLVGTVGFWFGL